MRSGPRARALVFAGSGETFLLHCESSSWWRLGDVGRLVLGAAPSEWSFRAYPDRRLRRVPALDDPAAGLWGWRIAERAFRVKRGIIPGRDGAVIREKTERVTLEVPREFVQLCRLYRIAPAEVLRGFIADLCGLHNFVCCPARGWVLVARER